MRHAGPLFSVLFVLWLLWSGHYEPLILTLGFFSCLSILLIMRRLTVLDDESVPLHFAPRALLSLPWLLFEIVKANLDVARRILQRRPAIRPHTLRVRADQQSDVGRVLFANSITLTPGTVSIEVHRGEILVHALSKEGADSLMEGEMDRRVTAVEHIG